MADFQARLPELAQRNTQVIAASVDSKEDAQELADQLGLTFAIAYGLDYMAFAEATGAFYEVRPVHVNALSVDAIPAVGWTIRAHHRQKMANAPPTEILSFLAEKPIDHSDDPPLSIVLSRMLIAEPMDPS